MNLEAPQCGHQLGSCMIWPSSTITLLYMCGTIQVVVKRILYIKYGQI